jgi:hypothetical protein
VSLSLNKSSGLLYGRIFQIPYFAMSNVTGQRCSGSVTFWYGSGSESDGILIFSSLTLICQKMYFFSFFAFCFLLSEGMFTSFLKDKSHITSQNSKNQGFFYYFWLMIDYCIPDPDLGDHKLVNCFYVITYYIYRSSSRNSLHNSLVCDKSFLFCVVSRLSLEVFRFISGSLKKFS